MNGDSVVGIWAPDSGAEDVTIGYASNRVSSITTVNGTTTYGAPSDVFGVRTIAVTNALSQTTTYKFNISLRRPISITNPLGQITRYVYDAYGRMTHVVPPEGTVDGTGNPVSGYTKTTYDDRGNVKEVRQVSKTPGTPADLVITSDYDVSCLLAAKCNKPNWTHDAKGNQTDYRYDGTTGNVTAVILPASTSGGVRPKKTYSYSTYQAFYKDSGGSVVASGQPISLLNRISTCQTQGVSSVDAALPCLDGSDEVRSTIDYGPQSAGTGNNLLPLSVTSRNGAGSLSSTITTAYDDIGNVLIVDGPQLGSADKLRYRYNANRERIGTVGPVVNGGAAAQLTHYNAQGLVDYTQTGTVSDQSDGAWSGFSPVATTATAYTNRRVTRSESRVGGVAGALIGVSQLSYDGLGRVDCTAVRMDPTQWGGQGDACASGPNMPDRIVRNSYDAVGRIQSVTSGYGTGDASSETNSYTPNGLVATVKDGRNNLTTYDYDGFDRLKKTRYPVATVGANASSTSDYEELTPDANGNVTNRRLRDGGTIDYGYDNLNRLSSMSPGGEATVTYSYDLLNRPTQISGSSVINYGWDALGRLTSDGQPYGTVSYQYDPSFQWTKIIWPDGYYAKYDVNAAGQVTTIHSNSDSGNVVASYGYDSLGRRASTSFGNGTSKTYAYDGASRLAGMKLDVANTNYDLVIGGVGSEGTAIGYNPASQIKQIARSNDQYSYLDTRNGQRGYTSNGLNQYSSALSTPPGGAATTTSYGYDGRGNLTSDGAISYTYNKLNQLMTAPGVTFSYDPSGRLSQQIVSGGATTRFLHNADGMMIAELDGSNGLLRRYLPGPGMDEPILWYESNGTSDPRYLMADERGSIVAVTNGAGNIIRPNSYDDYGQPAALDLGRFLYTGQAYLPEAKLYYYKARMYSAPLGRFLQTDPIGYADGLNWYAYTSNDPVNRSDPSGLDAHEFWSCYGNCGGGYWNSPPPSSTAQLIVQMADGGSNASNGTDNAGGSDIQLMGVRDYTGPALVTYALDESQIPQKDDIVATGNRPVDDIILTSQVPLPMIRIAENQGANDNWPPGAASCYIAKNICVGNVREPRRAQKILQCQSIAKQCEGYAKDLLGVTIAVFPDGTALVVVGGIAKIVRRGSPF